MADKLVHGIVHGEVDHKGLIQLISAGKAVIVRCLFWTQSLPEVVFSNHPCQAVGGQLVRLNPI